MHVQAFASVHDAGMGSGSSAAEVVDFPAEHAIHATPIPRIRGRSSLLSRNVMIAGHRTSMRLEPEMWDALTDIGLRERASLHDLCTAVAVRKHPDASLTAAIRVFIMAYYRAASTDDGHSRAGHGAGLPVFLKAARRR